MASATETEVKKGSTFNFHRKAWHLLGLLIPIILYFDWFFWMNDNLRYPTRLIGFFTLEALLVLLIGVDLLRFRFEGFRNLFYKIFASMMKAEEWDRFHATTPYFIANLILFLFFGNEVIMIAGILLMLGDPAAAYYGGKYGKYRFFNGKSLVGLVAFIVAGIIFSLLFLVMHTALNSGPWALTGAGGLNWNPILIVIGGSVFGAVAEFFSVTKLKGFLDDNLYVPLAAALGMLVVAHFVGFPEAEIFFQPENLFQLKN